MNQVKFNILYIIILATLSMTSCMVGPNFHKTEIASPDAFRFSENADTVLNMNWWELFNDQILLALIDSSLQNNKNMQIAASRIEEARLYLGYTKADLYPSIGYSGSAGYGNEKTILTGGDLVSAFSATGNISWEIDFWGKYRRATEAAKAELLSSEYGMRSVQMELINSICSTYFALLDYKNRKEIAERTLESRKESLRIIQEKFDKGTVPEIDLNQAQIQEAIAAAAIPTYERSIGFAENALSVLSGKSPSEIKTTIKLDEEILPPNIPNGIPSQLLARRPDILIAEQNVRAQNAQIGIAQAMRFPAISLTAAGGYAAFDATDENLLQATGGIFGPIFNFGKNKRRVEMAKQKTEQLKLAYENTVLNAFCETENALITIQTIKNELAMIEVQVKAATNAAKLSRIRYDGGVTSYLEVLDSERQLFNVELYYSQLLQAQLAAYTNLYIVLGGGWLPHKS